MQTLINEIKELIHYVSEGVYYYRQQNYAKAHQYSTTVTSLGEAYFTDALKVGFQDSVELLMPIWKKLLEAMECGDELLLADIYEKELIPALFDIQSCLVENSGGEPLEYWEQNMSLLEKKDKKLYEKLINAKERTDRGYMLGWASTGDMVMSVETKQYGIVQLSSQLNPWNEAVTYAQSASGSDCQKIYVFGIGMGYHVISIARKNPYKEIVVLENDLEQLRICMTYSDLSEMLSNQRVRIVLCPKAADYSKWLDTDADNEKIIYKIWYPSLKTIEDTSLRQILENFWVASNSIDNLGAMLVDNFSKNIELGDETVESIKEDIKGKNVILVAGGPSLDKSLDELKKVSGREDTRILCVGKVAAKIIAAGIMPDYIVMIDGKPGTRWQINGIEECGVPLIYLATVAYNVASDYKGKRYIAFQEDIRECEEYAAKNKLPLYRTGGSVATFALDLAIQMKCKKLICVGLDMGYTGDRTHAEGVGSTIADKKNLREVQSVSGGMIYTSKTLDIYRRWIERRIEDVKDIEIINASNGARIKGMKERDFISVFESL